MYTQTITVESFVNRHLHSCPECGSGSCVTQLATEPQVVMTSLDDQTTFTSHLVTEYVQTCQQCRLVFEGQVITALPDVTMIVVLDILGQDEIELREKGL